MQERNKSFSNHFQTATFGHLVIFRRVRHSGILFTPPLAKTIISYFPLIPLKRNFARARARDRNTAHANQSASQDCRLATPKKRKEKKRKQTMPDLRLGPRPLPGPSKAGRQRLLTIMEELLNRHLTDMF